MDTFQKLQVLAEAAKYDVACTSSGVDKSTPAGGIGNATACGICHSFAADGRCISLLKVLMSNACAFDCKYCISRRSNDIPRAAFTPREIADLTIQFYRRNYIEGLFLSSAVTRNPDYACEQMIEALRLLREEYSFGGYIHAKAIPGASQSLLSRLGFLADRISLNIELPSEQSLQLLAPEKSRESVLTPMGFIRESIEEYKTALVPAQGAHRFAPAGQSTQMIVGATPDTDYQILRLSESLYKKYSLKRVFFSAYIPVVENSLLPALDSKPQLLREHRLYQADWLLRFYDFRAAELLDEENQNFNPYLDPKGNWALNNLHLFPVEVNRASLQELLRVPGIGPTSARRIVRARRTGKIDLAGLKKLGVVLKRAQYFVTCEGKGGADYEHHKEKLLQSLLSERMMASLRQAYWEPAQDQLSYLAPKSAPGEEVLQWLTSQTWSTSTTALLPG